MSEAGKSREQLQAELASLLERQALEHAIERIRIAVLSMRSSDDMLKVVLVMFQELRTLGTGTPGCGFLFVDEDNGRILWHSAMENPRQYGINWTSSALKEVDDKVAVSFTETPIDDDWQQDLDIWRQGKTRSFERSLAEDKAEMQALHQILGLERFMPFIGEQWLVSNVPFKYGWLAFRHKPISAEHMAKVEELADALSLAYLRNLEFQRLEEQNAALETALRQLKETQVQLVPSQTS